MFSANITHPGPHGDQKTFATIGFSLYEKVEAQSTALLKDKWTIDELGTHLSHLSINHQNALKSAIIDLYVVTDSQHDLCSAQLPVECKFELLDDTAIHFKPRRLPLP